MTIGRTKILAKFKIRDFEKRIASLYANGKPKEAKAIMDFFNEYGQSIIANTPKPVLNLERIETLKPRGVVSGKQYEQPPLINPIPAIPETKIYTRKVNHYEYQIEVSWHLDDQGKLVKTSKNLTKKPTDKQIKKQLGLKAVADYVNAGIPEKQALRAFNISPRFAAYNSNFLVWANNQLIKVSKFDDESHHGLWYAQECLGLWKSPKYKTKAILAVALGFNKATLIQPYIDAGIDKDLIFNCAGTPKIAYTIDKNKRAVWVNDELVYLNKDSKWYAQEALGKWTSEEGFTTLIDLKRHLEIVTYK